MANQPPVSREDARRIATDYLREHDPVPAPITDVVPGEEVGLRGIYSLPAPRERLWVAYVAGPEYVLTSSFVVLVSKDTGEVLYYGSAHDEG